MNATYPFQKSPRCTATSKRSGKPCQAPAVGGYSVCRFHGARGGAPKGKANGAYKHGLYTAEAMEERRPPFSTPLRKPPAGNGRVLAQGTRITIVQIPLLALDAYTGFR